MIFITLSKQIFPKQETKSTNQREELVSWTIQTRTLCSSRDRVREEKAAGGWGRKTQATHLRKALHPKDNFK